MKILEPCGTRNVQPTAWKSVPRKNQDSRIPEQILDFGIEAVALDVWNLLKVLGLRGCDQLQNHLQSPF